MSGKIGWNKSNDLESQLKRLTQKTRVALSLEYELYKLTKNDLLIQLEKYYIQSVKLESKRDKSRNIKWKNKDKLQTLLNKKDNIDVTLTTLERAVSELLLSNQCHIIRFKSLIWKRNFNH